MKRNPERLAWFVIITAFIIFCLIVALVPPAVGAYVSNHTTVRPARLDIIQGTVLLSRAGTPGEQVAGDETTIEPGDSVRTAGDARAILWLFDDSNVEIAPDSTVTLYESEASTFSSAYSRIVLHLADGRPVVSVALPSTEKRDFIVRTNYGDSELALDEGSYALDLTKPGTGELIVRVGNAAVAGLGEQITCKTGQRAVLHPGHPPEGPLPLQRNLLANGDFTLPLGSEQGGESTWLVGERDREGNRGTVEIVEHRDGNYLRFARKGEGHCEDYAVQILNVDVSEYRSLRLEMEVRLVEQSLSGGGVAGTEYPFHVRLQYRDTRDRQTTIHEGLYFQNEDGNPVPLGHRWPQGQWHRYTLDLSVNDPRPASIVYVELAASGWDYESHVRNVRLIAE